MYPLDSRRIAVLFCDGSTCVIFIHHHFQAVESGCSAQPCIQGWPYSVFAEIERPAYEAYHPPPSITSFCIGTFHVRVFNLAQKQCQITSPLFVRPVKKIFTLPSVFNGEHY